MSDAGTLAASSASPPPAAAVWEDFIDIFYEPTAVFERRRGWSGWPVLLALTLILTALFVAWQQAMGPAMEMEMQRAMSRSATESPELAAEQMEQMRSVGRIFGAIGFALAFPLGVLVTTLAGWALLRLFGAAAPFATTLLVVTYAQIVLIAQFFVGLIQPWFLDVDRMDSVHDTSLSLARFLDQPATSDLMVSLAARVDLFTLWATALIAIGLHTLTTLDRSRAWIVAGLLWLLAAAPILLGAFVSG